MCVECLLGKQKKPILFKVTEFRTVQSSSREKGGVTVTEYCNCKCARACVGRFFF